MSDSIRPELAAFAELEGLVAELQNELAFFRGRARRAEEHVKSLEASGLKAQRPEYRPTDILDFDEAAAWWKVARRTCERMSLPWSNPVPGSRFRRILFSDLLKHYHRRQKRNGPTSPFA